jgi:hypothetical protein
MENPGLINLTPILMHTLRLLLICFFMVSCSSARMMETQLYFGQSKPGGSMVTEQEWNNFKKTQISRVFKEGSTIISSTGYWYDPENHQLVSEPTYLVIYFYKRSANTSKQIDSLRNIYKKAFQQQSILRIDRKVKARF